MKKIKFKKDIRLENKIIHSKNYYTIYLEILNFKMKSNLKLNERFNAVYIA